MERVAQPFHRERVADALECQLKMQISKLDMATTIAATRSYRGIASSVGHRRQANRAAVLVTAISSQVFAFDGQFRPLNCQIIKLRPQIWVVGLLRQFLTPSGAVPVFL